MCEDLSDGAPTPFEDRSLYHFVTISPIVYVKNIRRIPLGLCFLMYSKELLKITFK